MSDNRNNWEQQDKNNLSLHTDSWTSDSEEQQIDAAPKGDASQTLPASLERPNIIPKRPRNAHVPDQIYNLVASTLQVARGWTGKMVAIADQIMQLPATPPADSIPAPTSGISAPLPEHAKRWKRSRALRITMMRRQRRARWQREQPKTRQIGTGILMALALLLVILTCSGTAYGYTYYQSQLPRVQKLENQQISQTTRIYDRNMRLLYDAYDNGVQGGRRTPVTYDEVTEVMRNAIIASEDPSFWSNTGIDPQGILRASISFLQHDAVQSGGSTLTQQVVKNLTNNRDVTLNRKALEAVLAIGLTQQYPKWRILEMYFNVASFGPMDMGIESAVEEYFHLMPRCNQNFKCTPGVSQLDLDQQANKHDPLLGLARASLLAGLPQNPVTYYPAGGSGPLHNALARQKYVLGQMIKQNMSVQGLGPVTPTIAEKVEALTAKMQFTSYRHIKHAPHFVDWVINQVETALGNGDPNKGIAPFLTGGFNIRTTIDLKLEDFVESTVNFHLTQPEFHWFADTTPPINIAHNLNDAAAVVMNAHTGEILAMDGSADYNNPSPEVGGEYNAADPPPNADGTPAGRPTGSTFKPFDYVTAFEMGWYPATIVPDVQTFFPNGEPAGTSIKDPAIYHPPDYSVDGDPNYYGGDKGSTVRKSIAQSRNVGAVKAMEYAGPENVLTTVHRLGLTEIQNLGVSWALGTENASVLQMTDAYQAFANGGVRVPPQGVLDIWDNYGHNLYHYNPAHPPRQMVFSPQVSYLMTSILTDEPDRLTEFGGDHDLSFSDIDSTCATDYNACQHQVAAKTGTTDGPKDNWTMGYTPNVVVGVWSGNANNESMYPGTLGIVGAAPIWHSIIEALAGACPSPTYPTVPCPQNYDPTSFAHELGIGQQQTFVAPSGVRYACTSSTTGLLGTDNCDWMISGEEPTQTGVAPNDR